MFQGVAYLVSVLLAGLLIGAILEPVVRSRSNSEIARAFYWLTACLLILSFTANVSMILGYSPKAIPIVAKVGGTFLTGCFAAIFGIAIRRKLSSRLLEQPEILDAIRMAVALTFAIAGIGKAFNMPFMTQFFTGSGYPVTFLHFIMLAEVLGGVGFLLPWAFLPALLGFTIDMFGAIVTHIHNQDPLDDSVGAIGMLVRLAAITALVVVAPRGGFARFHTRARIVIATSATIACLAVAILGSVLIHSGK